MRQRPHWISVMEKDLQEMQRQLAEREEIARLAKIEREHHRTALIELTATLEQTQRKLAETYEALAVVRAMLRKHAGDKPGWRAGQEHTWLGQADLVAEQATAP
jgi:hypothetical protein